MHSLNVNERPYIELFDGEARIKVPPLQYHNLVEPSLAAILRRCAADRGFVGCELHMRLGTVDGTETVFVPDVTYTSVQKYRELYPGGDGVPEFAPEIAVEIRSPGFERREFEAKIAKYLGCGTVLVLDVDPQARSIAAHRAEGYVRRFERNELFEDAAFSWLRFTVAEAFSEVDRFERVVGKVS